MTGMTDAKSKGDDGSGWGEVKIIKRSSGGGGGGVELILLLRTCSLLHRYFYSCHATILSRSLRDETTNGCCTSERGELHNNFPFEAHFYCPEVPKLLNLN